MSDLGPIFDRLGLGQYVEKFCEEGFEAWETVLDITESDLEVLGVKLGHRRRLQREIANTRGVDIETIINAAPKSELQRQGQQSVSDCVDQPEADRPQRNKRKYRRHPKADGHAPDRPQSAYVIFSNKIRDDIKSENLSFTDIAKRVGELWQALTPEEKKPYELQAGSAKEEYMADLAHYKTTDRFREYNQYLVDFKAKHPPKSDGKKPKHDNHASTTSSESVGRQGDSTEPRLGSVSQEPDQHSYGEFPGYRQNGDGRAADVTPAYMPNHFFSRPRGSPSASVSSLASSGHPTNSTSPSIQYNPRQLPTERGSLERNVTTCPSPLPPMTTFDHRDAPLAQSSTNWFNSRPGTAPSNESPLFNYRRSHHPPPSFIQQTSTSSSKSTSHSLDSVETTLRSDTPCEEPHLYHTTPTSSGGSDTRYLPDKMNGIRPTNSRTLHEPQAPSFSQDYHTSSHRVPPLPNTPLDTGTPTSPPVRMSGSSVHRDPASPYHFPALQKTLPQKRKDSAPDDGIPRSIPPVDPLAVLAYAGGILDRQSRETC